MQPLHTFKGSKSILLNLLRFVNCQVQPFHTFKGSGSILFNFLRFAKCHVQPFHTFKESGGAAAAALNVRTRSKHLWCNMIGFVIEKVLS